MNEDNVICFNTECVMRMLGVKARSTIYLWNKNGKIDAIKSMDGSLWFSLAEINRVRMSRMKAPLSQEEAAKFSKNNLDMIMVSWQFSTP